MSKISPSFLRFFEDLSKNNTSEWFNENRKTYEKEVKKPFSNLVEEIITLIQKHDPEVLIKPSDAIMRINRDIRFSNDKTPYNTHVAANISKYGKKDKGYPGFYFQLSPEGVSIFGGAYALDNKSLQDVRIYIVNNLSLFSNIYNDKVFKEKFGHIQGEQHKRLSREFQNVQEKEPLIANKQFYYSAKLKPEIITSNNLTDILMEYYTAGKKVNDFLKEAF